ncbi:hypothetical protein [Roseibium suaedae]|uniref:Uncharacterized protein n=1 Tax=Roseibium suaedae TaxID=735517 RepID=A0A1M6Z6R7_9HYPH|nr:hypothetical protein [Roseibium suaedae]SHL26090.1 hypothetical protein SAMN05444272_0145 [Roseibium suaedae]
MNKVVIQQYPAEKLPADLRAGIPDGTMVKVTLETTSPEQAALAGGLRELFASVPGDFRKSASEIEQDLRGQRDSWPSN